MNERDLEMHCLGFAGDAEPGPPVRPEPTIRQRTLAERGEDGRGGAAAGPAKPSATVSS